MAQIFITQILPEKSGGRAELTERGVSLITLDTRSNNLCIRVVARRVDENRLCKSCNIDRSWNAICECRLSRSAYQKAKVATQGRKSVPSWRSERMAKKLKPRVLWIYHEFSRATVDRPASEIRARHSQQWNLWKMTLRRRKRGGGGRERAWNASGRKLKSSIKNCTRARTALRGNAHPA